MRSSSIASTFLLSLASAAIVFAAPISDKRGGGLACIPIPPDHPRSTEVCTGIDCVHCPPGTYTGVPYGPPGEIEKRKEIEKPKENFAYPWLIPPEKIEKREEDFLPCIVHCNAQGICYESGPGCNTPRSDQSTEKRDEDFGIEHPCHTVCDKDGKCECIITDLATTEKRDEDFGIEHPCHVVCDKDGKCECIITDLATAEKREEDFLPCTVHCNAQGICYESGPGCDASRNGQLTQKREEDFLPCTVHCNAQGVCKESGPGCDAPRNDQLIEKREEEDVKEPVKEKRVCIPKCVGEHCSCPPDEEAEEAVKEKRVCIPKCVGEHCSCPPDEEEE